MSNVKVVSAYVPLTVENMDRSGFKELGRRLRSACGDKILVLEDFPFGHCWLAHANPPWRAANERAADRFKTEDQHIRSNLIQHSCTQWASLAAAADPTVTTWVWLGYSILKQGAFTGKPVTEKHVEDFLLAVERYDFSRDIPFPGIEGRKPVLPHGNNWRFCGSTHIWPASDLPIIDAAYKRECMKFLDTYHAIPLDLAIWPAVEENNPRIPFAFYKAEYDATQLTNFPR